MEIHKIQTYQEFSKWFTENDLASDFPMIAPRRRGNANRKYLDIYYATENGEIVGLALCGISPMDRTYHIHLFEINVRFHRKGLGTKFFHSILEMIGDRPITLSHKGEKGEEAHLFWTKMGFVDRNNSRRMKQSHEMINAKYANTVKSIGVRACTVVRDIGGKIEIKRIVY